MERLEHIEKKLTEKFVTYLIAKKLKELGYAETCLAHFDESENNKLWTANQERVNLFGGFTARDAYDLGNYPTILAPLWQDAIDWFREQHSIVVDVQPIYINIAIGVTEICGWSPQINGKIHFEDEVISYYEAREKTILKAIKLCK